MSPTAPTVKTVFYAKVWYIYASAIVFTVLALFCGIFGPLFLLDIMKRADGKPGTEAGVAMCIMAIPMALVAMLGWFNIVARFQPLLRICQEGIEIVVIGASSLDGVPFIPKLVRLAWLIVSRQGFRKQLGWIPWETFRSIRTIGSPMTRSLVIDASIVYPTGEGKAWLTRIGESIVFRDADFKDPLEVIASSVQAFYDNPDSRAALPSLVG